MRLRTATIATSVALACAAAIACGSARRSEPIMGRPFVAATDDVRRGERVFMANCHQCHPGGEAGLGPALNNKPLPGFMIALQTRAGLGAMPAFTTADISVDDLSALIAYLKARRG
jgi:mono/diheme cytochrome c family protein